MTLPVPVQRTWSPGEIATGAELNSNMRDAINFLLNVPTLQCYNSVTQSVTNSTWTQLAMDTNVYDTYAGHSTVTNNARYTAQVAGIYLVIGRSAWATNATGVRGAAVTTNGSTPGATTPSVIGPTSSTSVPSVEVVAFIQMAAGDYVTAWGFQSSGGALNTLAGVCSLAAMWIHA